VARDNRLTRRILILTFYYEPDLAAGSFRATALVSALLERDPSVEIDVITTLPNRYHSFGAAATTLETRDRVRIRRIPLSPHRSGMRDQATSFMHFARKVMQLAAGERYDLVFATSSRLMTAFLGARVAARAHAPLYLDIRDIFVDTMADVLPRYAAAALTPILAVMERRTILQAQHVNLVSRGFREYFTRRYPRQSFSYYPNGIDDQFLDAGGRPAPAVPGAPLRILYAGNIGEGQGLHLILPPLAARLGDRVRFVVIGDGGRRPQLEAALSAAGVTTVGLRPPVQREQLVAEYRAADVLFLHLNDYDAFRKVLPSKIFEYAALGKPVWAGVAGYAAEFIRQEVSNASVFAPCDVDDAVRSIEMLEIRDTPRDSFIQKFRRGTIMRDMADDILSRVPPRA
jgi:glycosyltransferase involved in cell wall biosynthesis